MKTLLLTSAICFLTSYMLFAQSPGACSSKNPSPLDGSTFLGQTYNNSACGLNYVQASVMVQTRTAAFNFNSNGTGLPTTLSVSGIPAGANILKAYVWYFVSYIAANPPTSGVDLTNPLSATTSFPAVKIGQDQSKCWGETGTANYRADVTASITGNGNYGLNITGITGSGGNFPNWYDQIDGVTLFIIYKDMSASATYQGSLVIWDGNMTGVGNNYTQTMTGINACGNSIYANAFNIVSDMQDNVNGNMHPSTLNGTTIITFPNDYWNFDVVNTNVTSGQATATFGTDGLGSDCFDWGVMGLYYQTTNCTVCTPCLTTTVTIDSTDSASSCIVNNGAIYLSDTTTAGPLTYSWSNGATTQDVTGLAPGNYSVTITDTSNCSVTFFATIVTSSNISITIDSIDSVSSCPSGNNGAIYISTSGGIAPYTYAWSNGATTEDISGLTSGNYTLTVTDSVSCTNNFVVYVPYTFPILLNVSFTPSNCNASTGTASCSASGGTGAYTYLWSNGNTTQNSTGLSAGNYSVTVTDSVGCSATASVTIPLANPPTNPFICMVSVDSLSQNNVVIWDKTSFSGVDSFIVYREITTNNYQPIGAVPFDSLSLFVDTVRTKYFPNTGDPNAGTYRYKLQIKDSCGGYSTKSPYHNTIFMTGNNGTFSWPLYTIENNPNPVNAYVLMRDDYSSGNWNAINSVSGTQQTVTDPAYSVWQSTANYRIQTIWSITCTPSRLNSQTLASFNASLSNTLHPVISSVNESSVNNSISIYPNPTSGKFQITSDELRITNVEIYNVYGEKVYSTSVIGRQSSVIDISFVPSGIYFLKVKTPDGVVIKKIVKE